METVGSEDLTDGLNSDGTKWRHFWSCIKICFRKQRGVNRDREKENERERGENRKYSIALRIRNNFICQIPALSFTTSEKNVAKLPNL